MFKDTSHRVFTVQELAEIDARSRINSARARIGSGSMSLADLWLVGTDERYGRHNSASAIVSLAQTGFMSSVTSSPVFSANSSLKYSAEPLVRYEHDPVLDAINRVFDRVESACARIGTAMLGLIRPPSRSYRRT